MESKTENQSGRGISPEQFIEEWESTFRKLEFWVQDFEENQPESKEKGYVLLGKVHGPIVAFHSIMRGMGLNAEEEKQYRDLIPKYEVLFDSFRARLETRN